MEIKHDEKQKTRRAKCKDVRLTGPGLHASNDDLTSGRSRFMNLHDVVALISGGNLIRLPCYHQSLASFEQIRESGIKPVKTDPGDRNDFMDLPIRSPFLQPASLV